MSAPWTRLEGSELWSKAAQLYLKNNLSYHNLYHIKNMYSWAEVLELPYDTQLDENILAHDVVMNLGAGQNELASAEWLIRETGRDASWANPILATIDHRPAGPHSTIAMLDLMDFTQSWRSRSNTELVRREAASAQGPSFNQRLWLTGLLGHLDGLSSRIREDLPKLPTDQRYNWTRIARGIAVTMACAPHRYDMHPASGIPRYTEQMEATLRLLVVGKSPLVADDLAVLGDQFKLDFPHRFTSRNLDRLIDASLAKRVMVDGKTAWESTEHGRDWVAKMNAPHPEYPEPEFP